MTALHRIRSRAIAQANTLQRAHAHLDQLAPAFAEWASGEIYVCRKTGSYRYRFGDSSKSVAPWDAIARQVFATVEAFAFAALVLGEKKPHPVLTKTVKPTAVHQTTRANVVQLAAA